MTQTIFDTETLDRLNRIYSSRKSRKSGYIMKDGDLEFIDLCIPKSALAATNKMTTMGKLNWIKTKLPTFLVEQQKLKESGGAQCLICGLISNVLYSHIFQTHKLKLIEYKEKFGDVVTASHSYLKTLSDKVKGENNPAYQHGGKFSPYSKKFIKYLDLNDVELAQAISDIKDKNALGFTSDKRNTNIEYYLTKGMTQEDAAKALTERQTTFNLELCVDKHGILEGVSTWQDRQDKWGYSLKSKPQKEIDLMNDMKSLSLKSYLLRFGDSGLDEYIKVCNAREWKYFTEIEDLNEFLLDNFESCGYIEKTLNKIADYMFGVFGITDSLEYCKLTFSDKWGIFPTGIRQTKTQYGYYYDELDSYENHVVLRSSIEKKMHSLLVENNIKFLCEHQYPNSTLKYDFYLPEHNKYVEICGFMNDPVYVAKMHTKRDIFGAVLLATQKEMKNFIAECKSLNNSYIN